MSRSGPAPSSTRRTPFRSRRLTPPSCPLGLPSSRPTQNRHCPLRPPCDPSPSVDLVLVDTTPRRCRRSPEISVAVSVAARRVTPAPAANGAANRRPGAVGPPPAESDCLLEGDLNPGLFRAAPPRSHRSTELALRGNGAGKSVGERGVYVCADACPLSPMCPPPLSPPPSPLRVKEMEGPGVSELDPTLVVDLRPRVRARGSSRPFSSRGSRKAASFDLRGMEEPPLRRLLVEKSQTLERSTIECAVVGVGGDLRG